MVRRRPISANERRYDVVRRSADAPNAQGWIDAKSRADVD